MGSPMINIIVFGPFAHVRKARNQGNEGFGDSPISKSRKFKTQTERHDSLYYLRNLTGKKARIVERIRAKQPDLASQFTYEEEEIEYLEEDLTEETTSEETVAVEAKASEEASAQETPAEEKTVEETPAEEESKDQ